MQTIRSGRIEEIKALNLRSRDLIFPTDAVYYILEDENIIKCFLAVRRVKYGVKLQCNYTFPQYRNKGLFSHLLSKVLELYKNENVFADCLPASRNIYLNNGFKEYRIKQFKRFKIYYMKKERERWQQWEGLQ